MISLLSELRTKYTLFSKNQKNIADYILANPDATTLLSITDLAGKCDTSETTVMRLLKKLDYSSYQVFRINLAKELSNNPGESIIEDIARDDDINVIKKKVIGHTITAISDLEQTLSEALMEKVLDLLLSSKRIFFFGVGASASIAMDALLKFGKIGLNVCSYPDPHLMNILCSYSSPEDVLLAISHTGESREVLSVASLAKENGAKVIALTSYSNSTLAKQSHVFLSSSTNDKKYHSEAMASRIVQLAMIDILYVSALTRYESKFYPALNKSRTAVSLNKT
ncbi:MAG: MurR/RpiR family transcriptional regulator [Eubacteriaceae bacterium]